jgi:choline-sulfatase
MERGSAKKLNASMKQSILVSIVNLVVLCGLCASGATLRAQDKPNVLFLAVDDLKDWVGCLGGYEGTVHTPNIDRLAASGMLFANAHCASPKCAPSRAAIMTGLAPSTTGLYDNGHWWLPNLPDVVTLPALFRRNGYRVVGAGKIFHHTAGNNPPNQWDDFFRLTFRNDPWFRGAKLNYPWSEDSANPEGFPFSDIEGLGHENDWGSPPIAERDYDDALSVDYAVRFLEQQHDQQFFLACGVFRPHLPWYVPKRFFDLYSLDDVVLPRINPRDLSDVPAAGRKLAQARQRDFQKIREAGAWRRAVQAYLASISYADEQLGRVLQALEASHYTETTIVCLWSDHGWHLGEKGHWHKSTLWEEATRVPLIVRVPGLESGVCNRAVSLLDLYPTLVELCDLRESPKLDGVSLSPWISQPNKPRTQPAVIEYKRGNAAVRSDTHRLIRYADGSEELYDLRNDPDEWRNIVANREHIEVITSLRSSLPVMWADSADTKGAFSFEPETFEWVHKATGVVTRGMKRK